MENYYILDNDDVCVGPMSLVAAQGAVRMVDDNDGPHYIYFHAKPYADCAVGNVTMSLSDWLAANA